ncbi:Fez family zinc finger protein 2 [Podospora fimiseda]|uniref:Fez family zinc finger protein 2 n=1 Tax=Podospora fimiseda TaxID=252190 RepID=A0AAN7BKF7_9PEZI|nr:Fez family zinc finger protein 2 [Podospora fimiseda]
MQQLQSDPLVGGGDLMDLDMDLNDLDDMWVREFDHQPLAHIQSDFNMACNQQHQLPDLLFAEDEGFTIQPLVPQQYTSATVQQTTATNATDIERLRKQLSLLSRGWCGDEIRFKNCDPAKSIILHNLAIELGLGYLHNVRSREVSISRLESIQSPIGRPRGIPKALSTSTFPRSSTELDSTLCLPGPPSAPPFPQVQLQDLEIVTAASQLPSYPVHVGIQSSASETPQQQQQPFSRSPSRSERLTDSISKHVSTLKTSISISKGGRRGPLTEDGRRAMRALDQVGGACWRCRALRRKCDLNNVCRSCLQSVPMPHLGEDAPLWPLIGCRRGPLRDSIPRQLLCPGYDNEIRRTDSRSTSSSTRRCRSVDIADKCLSSAESQRLADMKAIFEGDSYELSIIDPSLRDAFFSFIEAGRYRDRESLHLQYTIEGGNISYTELIAIIAWELSENQGLLSILEIRSWESFMGMLETACIYESEVGQTSLVISSMACLRHCLEALRLHSAQLLSPGAHKDCGGSQCQVECIQNLSLRLSAYVDELSSVIFNKENMRDRRWWLSTFYSLCIQSYVRHALIIIERQLRFTTSDDVAAEELTATQHLHLATVLFTAASAKYDPLLGGRLQYALTENSVIPETSVPELHHSSARVAFEVDKWAEAGIRTPYQFLRRLLQIGSLDFESEEVKSQMFRPSGHRKSASLSSFSVDSPPGQDGFLSPRSSHRGHLHRNSFDSRYSGHPSTVFSNQSSDSLAFTFSTQRTSMSGYEPSLLTNGFSLPEVEMDLDTTEMAVVPEPSPEQNLNLQVEPPITQTFICECCPRTPRHFKTKEELQEHEASKPHPCTQCKKRFKSPTEAERHINAIHLKSDSWSCKALSDPLLAFYSEIYHGTQVWDVCAYCGGGFIRSEKSGSGPIQGILEEEKKVLVGHLESVHKLGECDRDKMFYRADNFRQHLKNTHVAKPGKWLKSLEKVCRSTNGREGGGG